MKAQIMPKISNEKRTPLEEVIPLKVPYSIQIDIADACNMKCNFCFHSDLYAINKYNVKFGIMSWEIYKKILDDIKSDWGNIGKVKKLRLFALGEPLLNKNIIRMAQYAKNLQVADTIEITTNGTLLDNEFCSKVADSGIGIINISMNGICAEQYYNNCGYKMDWNEFVSGIKNLYDNRGNCKVFIKLSDIGYSDEEKKKFYEIFGDICDQIFIEGISSSLWQDTKVDTVIKKNDKGIYGQEIIRKKVCTTIFTTMVINSRGQVKLCCADWKNTVILGDLNTQSIKEVWEGSQLKTFQIAFLKGKRDAMDLCANCEQPEITNPDNIDDHMSELLERIEQTI